MRNTLLDFVKGSFVCWTIYNLSVAFITITNDDHAHADHSTDHQMILDNDGNNNKNVESTVIAYAVSLIKCNEDNDNDNDNGDTNTALSALIDASLIMRHSVHKISSRDPTSGSKYDYKMYAIVHKQAQTCSAAAKLKEIGFEIVLVDAPLDRSLIQGEYLRNHIHIQDRGESQLGLESESSSSSCCGEDEFIKLNAYSLPHEVIVHVDLDYAFYKPMDHLFDSIIYDKDSRKGKKARSLLELERPGERLPDKIGAFITRDWGRVVPAPGPGPGPVRLSFPPPYQAGFLVARNDPNVMKEMLDIVKEGNYTGPEGFGIEKGWNGSGHGGYVGAMAMRGLVTYFYDHVRKDDAVELNQCRFNHIGMDVLYRHPPNDSLVFVEKEYLGGCRNTLEYCEDCMVTEFDKIYSVHYTMCKRPWQCISEAAVKGGSRTLDVHMVNVEHCHEVVRRWHKLRVDFENKLYSLTGDETILNGTKHGHKQNIFQGHCKDEGDEGYVSIAGKDDTFKRIVTLYD